MQENLLKLIMTGKKLLFPPMLPVQFPKIFKNPKNPEEFIKLVLIKLISETKLRAFPVVMLPLPLIVFPPVFAVEVTLLSTIAWLEIFTSPVHDEHPPLTEALGGPVS